MNKQWYDLRLAAHRVDLQIAIDGPAGAGKSTVGRHLADALDCPEVDTGLMYRAVTREALDRTVPLDDGEVLADLAQRIHFSLGPGTEGLAVNGDTAADGLRSGRIDAAVSQVSAHPEVRRIMVERQRGLAHQGCIVMVGRDIGTVVLPDAPVKLWVTASPETRARRRLEEHLPGDDSYATVLEAIRARDDLDSKRKVSPLVRAPDAIVVDTDHSTPEAALQCALVAVAKALCVPESSHA